MKSETRRLNKLKDTSHNLAKRYRLSEAALKIIEKAGKIHGQQSRAIQVAVELIWNMPGWGVPDESMSDILNSPVTAKTYKLPRRTVSLIEALAHEYSTQGNVLAAVAYVLTPDPDDSRPDLRARLTRMPGPDNRTKIIYDKSETAETLLTKHEQEPRALTKRRHRKKSK